MSYALVFPGQGTQHPDMLPWLGREVAGGEALRALEGALGADWRARLAEPAWAERNDVAQPLLAGVCLAAWEAVRGGLPRPAAVAGYSVGELAAFAAAGVFDIPAALRLAGVRAAAMDACARAAPGGLLAVSDFAIEASAAAAVRHGLAVAIRLSPLQCLLGGAPAALDGAAAELARAGARCKRLPIAVASHTPQMQGATDALRAAFAGMAFARPDAVVVCDASARAERTPAALKEALAAQVSRTVAWDACMDALAERRVRCVLELGPGATLAKLWNARHPGIPAHAIDEFRSPQAASDWVSRQVA